MSKYALLAGMGLLFVAASGKLLIRVVRKSKLEKAGMTFDSAKAKFFMGGFDTPMTRREASLILGVKDGSSEEVVIAAHKRLMLVNHPDNGGSTYMAMKINEAKDLLLHK